MTANEAFKLVLRSAEAHANGNERAAKILEAVKVVKSTIDTAGICKVPPMDYLLVGIEALTKPDLEQANKTAGRNDRLLHAVLCAYAKHHLDCPDIGWDQLGEILHSVICNEIGDDQYVSWSERIKG